jgi:hypothetical protein
MHRTAACCLALALAACEKSAPPPATRPPTSGGGATPEVADTDSATDVSWAQKSPQQRMELMSLVVYPSMKEAFQSHDAARWGDFSCETCHGDDGKARGYAMPNAVTPLSAADPIADGNAMDAEVTKFMVEVVVPRMMEHLGTGASSADNPDGIGCLSCHVAG